MRDVVHLDIYRFVVCGLIVVAGEKPIDEFSNV